MKSFKSFIIVFIAVFQAAALPVKTISADSLQKMLNNGVSFDFLLIDVRETSELSGIIATENCRPYNLPYTSHVIDSNLSRLPKNAVIILYCQSGGRSGKADSLLNVNGFSSAVSLTGGFSNWKGPTKDSTYLKPLSDLPAPSMLKTSPIRMMGASPSSQRLKICGKGDRLIASEILTATHTLRLYAMNGACLFQVTDPFHSSTGFRIPALISPGAAIVEVRWNGNETLVIKHR